MALRGSAKAWWDRMFAPKGARYTSRRRYEKNGARECERHRNDNCGDVKYLTGYWQQKALERAAARKS